MTKLCRIGEYPVIFKDKLSSLLSENDIILEYFDAADSTNARAKQAAPSLFECGSLSPRLYVAREQSAGRGRMGRHFFSQRDRGIFMSLLCFTRARLSDAVSITTAAAAFVAEAIEKYTGERMKIKWVNDIYNEKGKVSGILVETLSFADTSAIIIGIGINTGEESFPAEISSIASSIGDISGKEAELISDIAYSLMRHIEAPEGREYMDFYRSRFMLTGKNVSLYTAGEYIFGGTVLGVDESGGLILRRDGESEPTVIHSGEVTVR